MEIGWVGYTKSHIPACRKTLFIAIHTVYTFKNWNDSQDSIYLYYTLQVNYDVVSRWGVVEIHN